MLEFVWIEEYGVIKNQGFNFNPQVYYSFNDKTGELVKTAQNEMPDNFFSISNNTVENITALVGANGTGKSTVLEFISSFLTYFRPLGGFIILNNQIINKSDVQIIPSKSWIGKVPKILNRRDLINNHRRKERAKEIDENAETRNSVLGLKILENIITDTRIIYYSGEANLEHTNRVYQSLLGLSDEFENSHFTDMSDVALTARDQTRYRSDKAIYSGENPILAYRSGESERFIELMRSEYRNLIPFSLESLSLGLSFNGIDKVFFESYDEMAFESIASLMYMLIKQEKKRIPAKTSTLLKGIQDYGLGGYFNSKYNDFEKGNPAENLVVNLYHHLLLRHLREQLMETMGELAERNKLRDFTSLLSEIEKAFTTSKSYLEQIQDYFRTTRFASNDTGTLNLKAVDAFYKELVETDLWKYERFKIDLSEIGTIDKILLALRTFDKDSGLKYRVSSIFDLDV